MNQKKLTNKLGCIYHNPNMKNKKILILGSSGFLGSHLTKALYKKNEVIQFDTESPPSLHTNSKFIQGSILDKELVQRAMEDVDIVYHFAAMTDLDIVNNNPAQAIEVNITGTEIIPTKQKDGVQRDKRNEPDPNILRYWQPEIGIKEGIVKIIEEMK